LIASVLDELQSQKDIIFVVAGTNKNAEDESVKKIGSPADSINSVVVNSVRMDKKPASYTRRGIVLSFFAKPDVSYYGGDEQEPLNACSHSGLSEVKGTSFAAP
jgi:AAA-ATPase, putative